MSEIPDTWTITIIVSDGKTNFVQGPHRNSLTSPPSIQSVEGILASTNQFLMQKIFKDIEYVHRKIK